MMDITYQVIALAILAGSIATGFIIFRMQGMRLAPHFGAVILALIVTLAAVITRTPAVGLAAAFLQIVAMITAWTQLWPVMKDSFQTAPAYSAHIALMTMLPVFALAGLFL